LTYYWWSAHSMSSGTYKQQTLPCGDTFAIDNVFSISLNLHKNGVLQSEIWGSEVKSDFATAPASPCISFILWKHMGKVPFILRIPYSRILCTWCLQFNLYIFMSSSVFVVFPVCLSFHFVVLFFKVISSRELKILMCVVSVLLLFYLITNVSFTFLA